MKLATGEGGQSKKEDPEAIVKSLFLFSFLSFL